MIHLGECEPEWHPDWKKTTFKDATQHGAVYADLCPAVEYMRDELYLNEEVWVGGEHE